eukprot:g4401.t1
MNVKFSSFRPLRPSIIRPLRLRNYRCRRISRSHPEEGSMPYQFDQQELDELLEMMPPRLDGEPLPNSDLKFKRLMDKHGLSTDALFGVDFEQRVKEQKKLIGDIDDWIPPWSKDPKRGKKDDKPKQSQSKEERERDAKEFAEWVDFGFECMRERELEEIFYKAMELHHSQRARARNIYAACLWYSKKLEEAEIEDHFQGQKESPIPSFIRAFFTLEEEFDELNEKQYEVELKKQERTRTIQDAEYKEFLRTKVISMPMKPGSDMAQIFDSFEMEKEDKPKEIEDDGIDYLLKGILPHVDESMEISKRIGEPKELNVEELLFKDAGKLE